MSRKCTLTLLLVVLAVSAALAAPRALSIFINDTPFSGKALWYKERVYVSAEDLAVSLHATYSFNPATGEVRITLPAPTASASPSTTLVPGPAASSPRSTSHARADATSIASP